MATREAIRAAAVELFVRHGFDAVSVEEVADAADVGASTVYRHFPTKEDLVLGRLRDRQAEFADLVAAVTGVRTVGELLVAATQLWAPEDDEQVWLRGEVALAVGTPALLARLQHQIVEWEAPGGRRSVVVWRNAVTRRSPGHDKGGEGSAPPPR